MMKIMGLIVPFLCVVPLCAMDEQAPQTYGSLSLAITKAQTGKEVIMHCFILQPNDSEKKSGLASFFAQKNKIPAENMNKVTRAAMNEIRKKRTDIIVTDYVVEDYSIFERSENRWDKCWLPLTDILVEEESACWIPQKRPLIFYTISDDSALSKKDHLKRIKILIRGKASVIINIAGEKWDIMHDALAPECTHFYGDVPSRLYRLLVFAGGGGVVVLLGLLYYKYFQGKSDA